MHNPRQGRYLEGLADKRHAAHGGDGFVREVGAVS
jgi:hypothetical protein